MNLSHEHFSASEINSYAQGVFNQVGNLIMLLSFVEFLYEYKICKKNLKTKIKTNRCAVRFWRHIFSWRQKLIRSWRHNFYDVKNWSTFDVTNFNDVKNLMTSRSSFSKWQTRHKQNKAVFYLIVQWTPVERAQ